MWLRALHPVTSKSVGLVRLGPVGAVWLQKAGAGDADVLVPSEYAPAHVVDLPLLQQSARRSALPFAVEDRVCQSLDQVHVALGPQISLHRYLAAVVEHARLRIWTDTLASEGIAPRRIIPDATVLPPPEGVAGWSVSADGDRLLVRTQDGDAFATSAQHFKLMWDAAGQPALQRNGSEWPDFLPEPVSESNAPPLSGAASGAVDLLQGLQKVRSTNLQQPLRVAAVILAVAILVHTLLLAIDAAAAQSAAAERRAEARQVLATIAPEMATDSDPASVLGKMLPSQQEGMSPSTFLPLFARAIAAMDSTNSGLSLLGLSYAAEDGSLILRVEAGDLAALENYSSRLQEAGLDTQNGGSSVSQGRAEASITVRDGSAGES